MDLTELINIKNHNLDQLIDNFDLTNEGLTQTLNKKMDLTELTNTIKNNLDQFANDFVVMKINLKDVLNENINLVEKIYTLKDHLAQSANIFSLMKLHLNQASDDNLEVTELMNTLKDNLDQSAKNLNLMEENLKDALKEKINFTEKMYKLKGNLDQSANKFDLMKVNLDQTLNIDVTEIINTLKYDLDQTLNEKRLLTEENNKMNTNLKQHQIEMKSLQDNFDIILNEKNNLNESLKEMEKNLKIKVENCQCDVKSLETNLTKTIDETKNRTSAGAIILKEIIVNFELFKTDYAENLIELLNLLPDKEDIIYGYRLLFDLMKRNQHIYSTQTTTIANRVFTDFSKTHDKNKDLVYLKENLLESFKNFPWEQEVVIQNIKLNETIKFTNPSNALRSVPCLEYHNKNAMDKAISFIPISNGKYFHIKSIQYNMYLYAEADEFYLDKNKRRVFLWANENETRETGRWQLEPMKGSIFFKIKNIYWNEYLAEAGKFKANYTDPLLCTVLSGECKDNGCTWTFVKFIKE